MSNYKNNYYKQSGFSKFLEIVVISLVLAALVAGVIAIGSLFEGHDAYSNVNPRIILGTVGYDAESGSGTYVKDDSKLYTPDSIQCTGLRITPKHDVVFEYQIHYYDENDIYLGYSSHSDSRTWIPAGQMPENAVAVRIVIFPENGSDTFFTDNGLFNAQGFANRLVYSNALTIEVTRTVESNLSVVGTPITLIKPQEG